MVCVYKPYSLLHHSLCWDLCIQSGLDSDCLTLSIPVWLLFSCMFPFMFGYMFGNMYGNSCTGVLSVGAVSLFALFAVANRVEQFPATTFHLPF